MLNNNRMSQVARRVTGVFAATIPASIVLSACIAEPVPLDEPSEQTDEAAQAVTSVRLPVVHQTQFATGCAKPNNYCCGPTASNMATAYLHGVAPTSAYLKKGYEYLGLNSCCGTGTNVVQVANVAKNVGNAPNSAAYCMSFAYIKSQLQMNRPVALQITYNLIDASRRCGTFTVPHMVLVTGYDENLGMWYGEDPFCTGSGQAWTSTEFRAAAKAQATNMCGSTYEAVGDVFAL